MRKRILTPMLLLGMSAVMQAQTPGRLVYLQLGGVETLTNQGNTGQLFQVGKTGSSNTPVLIATLSSAATTGMTFSGTATSENNLSRTGSGRYLLMTGYDGPATSGSSRSGATSALVPRVIGRFDFTGATDFSTRLSDAFSANNIRGAVISETPVSGNYRIWASGANDGIRVANYGATTSTVISNTAQVINNRLLDIVNGDLVFSSSVTTGGNVIGLKRIVGLPTSGSNTIQQLVDTTGTVIVPNSFCFVGNPTGTLDVYISSDANGVFKYRSLNGMAGPFQNPYQVSTTNVRHMCTDGQVLYGITVTAANNNAIVGIWDGGSLGASVTQTIVPAVGTSSWIKGVQLAPEPIVVDSSYASSGTPGNIITLRSSNNAQRSLRVVFVPDSNPRSSSDLPSAAINYSGQAVKTATDSSGATYIAIQSVTLSGGALVPALEVRKVPAGGGTPVSSTVQNIPAGYEAFAITVDSTNRPVVAYRPGAGTSDATNVRFVRWSADLSTATLFDNAAAGFSSGAKVPTDISVDPSGTDYLRVLFASGSTLSTTAFTNTFSAGTATADLNIANDGAISLNPRSGQIGTDGSFRILSTGTGANRALFRVDTLNAGSTAVTTTGRAYRRDGTAPNESYAGNTATAPAFMWAMGLSMGGNAPRVTMTSTSEPLAGPNVINPRNDVVLGSGRVWTFDTSNLITASTYRFAPGFSPVN